MEDKKCIEVLKELFVTDEDTHFEQEEREEQNDAIEYAIKAIEVNAELLEALKAAMAWQDTIRGMSLFGKAQAERLELRKILQAAIKKATT